MMRFRLPARLLCATTTASLTFAGLPLALAHTDDVAQLTVSNITDFHGYCCLLYTSDAADE